MSAGERQRGFMVGLDPSATAAKILGTKNTKASSGTAPVPTAPLLLGPVPGSLMKPVAAAVGILPRVVLV